LSVRAVFFCNEMFGMGHLRRSLALAAALTERESDATALVVTGAPAYGVPELPPRVDILKLPGAPIDAHSSWNGTTVGAGSGLALAVDHIWAIRSEICLAAVRALAPDVVVVDYKPLGRGGDLLAALTWCRNEGDGLIVLGLRDFDDDLARLFPDWSADRMTPVRGLYDFALLYGRCSDDDLRLDALAAAGVPIVNTDLVAAPAAASGPRDLDDGYVLVTTGGGVDGFELLEAVLSAIPTQPLLNLPFVMVAGPMMAGDRVDRLRELAGELVQTQIFEYRSDMVSLLAGARAVVSMAGYSTVAEIVGSGKPALLVPRSFPSREQLNRARRWAAEGRVALLEPGDLAPARLGETIARLIAQPPFVGPQQTGADDAVTILLQAARDRRGAATGS
jgi:predicted glycosyltransferase